MRHRTVSAMSVNRNVDCIARCVDRAFAKAEHADRILRMQMQSVCALDAVFFEHTGFYHRARTPETFLGGLKAKHDGAGDLSATFVQNSCGAKQNRNVSVMPACVHQTCV